MNSVVVSQYSDRKHGIPRYAVELADRLPDTQLLRYNTSGYDEYADIQWSLANTPAPVAIGKFCKHPWHLRSVDADVYHAADPREVVPLLFARRKPIVSTLHDLIVYRHPGAFDRRWMYLSRLYLQFVNRSDHIIAQSKSTKRDAVDILGINPEKITVVYPGVDESFRPISEPGVTLENLSILMVGRPQPRKNHHGVAEAVGRLRRRGIDAHLYVVGADDDDITNMDAEGKNKYIHGTGYISDEDLIAYYNAVDVVAVPSFYEGFGFPAAEAMACGTPVVASDRSSLPEVVGDAGICVDPNDVVAIADALESILEDSSRAVELADAGLKQVNQFNWDRTARETRAVYERVW